MQSAMTNRPLPATDLDHILEHTRDVFGDLANARLFLTGGTGFFGHWILESLLHANRELALHARVTVLTRNANRFLGRAAHIACDSAVTLLEGDIRNFTFPAERHTHVIHAATDSGGRQSGRPAYELAESIVDGARRVLAFARQTGAIRLLFPSTGAVYGRSVPLLHIPETYPGGPDPLLLASSYDEAKRMAEQMCVAYSQGTPLACVIARPFAFVGPHLPLDTHFAIGNFIGAAIAGEPIHILGDGMPRRSFLYAADLAIWLWHLLMRGAPNRAYNVGSPDGVSLIDLARLTARTLRPSEVDASGSSLAIRIDGRARPTDRISSYVPDVTRAARELGLGVTVSLEEAIRRTAAWHGFPGSVL